MFDRLGPLALKIKRPAPVIVGFGEVRLDAQGLLEVFDRLGRLALMIEHHAPVVVGFGVRPDS